jgi:hypothetical protein
MPSFKPKSIKKFKYNRKTSITLDTKHNEFLNEFDAENDTINSYINKKNAKEVSIFIFGKH